MNHEHYQELTSQFIDRELTPRDEADLFAHLANCDECRSFLKTCVELQGDIQKTKPAASADVVSVTSGVERVTRSGLASPPSRSLRSVWKKRVPFPVAAAFAILALLSAIGLAGSWMQPKEKVVEAKSEIVYVPRLPAIQVIGFYPQRDQLNR